MPTPWFACNRRNGERKMPIQTYRKTAVLILNLFKFWSCFAEAGGVYSWPIQFQSYIVQSLGGCAGGMLRPSHRER